jgi:hypothetical protein
MVIAASGNNPDESLMKFAANLTIDTEELAQFNNEKSIAPPKSTLPVNATTQDIATEQNYNSAADRNNMDMLALFGQGLEKGKPGHD